MDWKTFWDVIRFFVALLFVAMAIWFFFGVVLGIDCANAADHAIDSTMTLANCRDVPDSCVLRGYEVAALILYDEWGDPYVADEETCLSCPAGTRKMGGNTAFYLTSNPPMREVSCWTIKTVCDTVWTKEER